MTQNFSLVLFSPSASFPSPLALYPHRILAPAHDTYATDEAVAIFNSPMAAVSVQFAHSIPTAPLDMLHRSAAPSTSAARPIFVLGTRNSKLAMVQTELVKRLLEDAWPGIEIRICGMVSSALFFWGGARRGGKWGFPARSGESLKEGR